MTQRVIEITSPAFVPADRLPRPCDGAALFGRQGKLVLEIGCGTGGFVTQLARREPDALFLAIDIYNRGCDKSCRKVDRLGLDNVRVSRVEAGELVGEILSPGSLSAVYINCPDPWPKKRHRKRRLVDRDFLSLLGRALTPNGELFFVTDFADYAGDVADAIDALPGWSHGLEERIASFLPGYPLSKYMQRYLDEGEPLFFLCAVRQEPGLSLSPRDWSQAAND